MLILGLTRSSQDCVVIIHNGNRYITAERLGRYGILRLHFIAKNKQAFYETLLMTNKLTHHLLLVSDSCENYYKELMENYIKNDERLSKKTKN